MYKSAIYQPLTQVPHCSPAPSYSTEDSSYQDITLKLPCLLNAIDNSVTIGYHSRAAGMKSLDLSSWCPPTDVLPLNIAILDLSVCLIERCRYRPIAFLLDSLGHAAFPPHIRINIADVNTVGRKSDVALRDECFDLCFLYGSGIYARVFDGYVGPAAEEEIRAGDLGCGLVPVPLLAPAVVVEARIYVDVVNFYRPIRLVRVIHSS